MKKNKEKDNYVLNNIGFVFVNNYTLSLVILADIELL